ncbi:MAG TPA: EAL domain-containing protein, partial [Acetobacteraceae bacterium]|nr:EAL domain-containing protein [Acetobacteraceae bacterium]
LSLMSVLPFSEWQMAAATPGAMAFRPVIVVFLSELGVSVTLGLLGTGVDRQIATQFARENERLRQLSESTFEALVIHRDGTVLDANSAFCSLVGRSLSEIEGEPVDRFVPAAKDLSLVSPVTGRPEPLEIEIAGADNTPLPVELLSRDIPYTGGAARVTALRDIRERRAAEQRIWYLAQHDLLTGLPNRAHFNDVMTRQLALSKRDGIPLAVFCIDLDRFKHVNDTLGHAAGDLLLKQVADRITAIIREGDTLARIGGDEFVLLQTGAAQPEGSAQLAQRVIDRLTEPFDLNGSSATVGASIGVALAPQDADKADELVSYADIALYRAKANGRGAYCFFKTGMDTLLRQRRELEQSIARAIGAGEFTLDFQPLFSGESTDQLIGFEALLRWPDPVRGMIPPADFIPLAEECGLIVPLGAWVLQAACREAVSWPEPWRVAVNVSPRQFTTGDLVATVRDVLDRTGLDPARLEIEITETLLITDSEAARRTLQNLKGLGVRIVLDDFGTGYSSLSYLQRFPFDKVKIDRSFVTGLVTNDNARAIVNAILAMSHQLHLEVTAEGVEQEAQLSILRSSHCDQIQGFLLARPIPQLELQRFIECRGNAGQDRVDEAALSH